MANRDTDRPRAPIAALRHPKVFGLASKALEVLAERRLLGESRRNLPDVTAKVNIARVLDQVCERHGWTPGCFADETAPFHEYPLSRRGVYGTLHVALCHAWAAAHPPEEFIGAAAVEGFVAERTDGPRTGMTSMQQRYGGGA